MATNVDFNALIQRIDTATNTLEITVGELDQAAESVGQAVDEAEAFAHAADIAATAAQGFEGQAALEAIAADQARQDAVTAKNDAQDLVTALEQAVIIDEAPVDGKQYARSNAEWVEVEASGGGTVQSVNEVLPDETGNITLAIPAAQVNSDWNATEGVEEILNKPTLFSGSYDDLSDKPTIPTQGITSLQAGDNITIDNTDPLSPVINASGGGGGGNFPGFVIPNNTNPSAGWYYTSADTTPPDPATFLDTWVSENPNDLIASYNTKYWDGSTLTRLDSYITFPEVVFLPPAARNSLPAGGYRGNIQAQGEGSATMKVISVERYNTETTIRAKRAIIANSIVGSNKRWVYGVSSTDRGLATEIA